MLLTKQDTTKQTEHVGKGNRRWTQCGQWESIHKVPNQYLSLWVAASFQTKKRWKNVF
jgi:hypothetical protein